jgi:hypothetical protein
MIPIPKSIIPGEVQDTCYFSRAANGGIWSRVKLQVIMPHNLSTSLANAGVSNK